MYGRSTMSSADGRLAPVYAHTANNIILLRDVIIFRVHLEGDKP